jgi:integrase
MTNKQPDQSDLDLNDLWKCTNSMSWYASTTKKISYIGLDSPISVHNDIKKFSIEKAGGILNSLANIDIPVQTRSLTSYVSIKEWLWNHYVTGKISSLKIVKILSRKKKTQDYGFYRSLFVTSNFLAFCSSQLKTPVNQITDNHLEEHLFDKYLKSKDFLDSTTKIVISQIYRQFYPGKGITFANINSKRTKTPNVSHVLLEKHLERLTQIGSSKIFLNEVRLSCSRFLYWIRNTIIRFQCYELDEIPIFLVQTEDLIAFRQYLLKQIKMELMGDSFASHIFYNVRAWFAELYSTKILPNDITFEVKAIPAERYHERDLPTDQELQRYFDAIQNCSSSPLMHTAAYGLMLYLGLRLHEVSKLRWNDINWATRTVSISGKGNQSELLPLPSVLIPVLTAHQKSNQTVDFVFGLDPSKTYSQLYEYYKLFALIADWKFPGGVHLFRHCFITRLSKLPHCPPQVLMRLARHKRPENTTRYLHRDNELNEAVDKIRFF